MPGLGGRELMQRIRQLGLRLPLLAMSGFLLPEDKSDHIAYLQKPFTCTDLLRKVRQALGPGTAPVTVVD
jgi:CheY-like chemotaxis protein